MSNHALTLAGLLATVTVLSLALLLGPVAGDLDEGSVTLAVQSGRVGSRAQTVPQAPAPAIATVVLESAPPPREPLVAETAAGHFGPSIPREGRTTTLLPVVRRDGVPVAAEIAIVAGPDEGLRFFVAATDEPQPVALYPGFALLEVRPVTGGLCRREWRLDHRRSVTLDLDFASRPREVVTGEVRDGDGLPVAGALVTVDGVETVTGNSGAFACEVFASGDPLLLVEAPGLMPHRELLSASRLASGAGVDVTLKPGLSLTIGTDVLPEMAGGGEVVLQLLPAGGPRSMRGGRLQALYPWERVNPIRLPVGGQVTLEDLPACRFDVVAWHGRASSRFEVAYLVDEERFADRSLIVPMIAHDTLTGRVVEGGEPVPNAVVRLEYENPIRAMHRALGQHAEQAWRVPVGLLPAAVQEVTTDADGRFALGLDQRIGRAPYVSVAHPSGRVSMTRQVEESDVELLFDLQRPTTEGRALRRVTASARPVLGD